MPIICTIQKSPMGDLGSLPTASGGLTGKGGIAFFFARG